MHQTNTVVRQLREIDWDFSGFFPGERSVGIHGIHWYPAPFPPAVASTLIDILGTKAEVLLDPFCGSSVAPIEAWFRGKRAFGLDVNQFAIEISRSKVQLLAGASTHSNQMLEEDYDAYRRRVLSCWKNLDCERVCEKARIHFDAIRWFVPDVLREIAIIKSWILEGGPIPEPWRMVLVVTLSSLLHKQLSIARNYHYTYIVDRSNVKEESRDPVDVPVVFRQRMRANFTDAQLARQQKKPFLHDKVAQPEFLCGTAQGADQLLRDKVDLVITSPPYFGMNDYVRSQYLSWLVFQWKGYGDDLLNESGSRRSRCSQKSLESYFRDIQKAFDAVYKVLRKGGYLATVLGCSETALAKKANPLAKIEKMLIDEGFDPVWMGKRRVRFRKINNTPYRTEAIWVFRR
jgi:DNA modification methylase